MGINKTSSLTPPASFLLPLPRLRCVYSPAASRLEPRREELVRWAQFYKLDLCGLYHRELVRGGRELLEQERETRYFHPIWRQDLVWYKQLLCDKVSPRQTVTYMD